MTDKYQLRKIIERKSRIEPLAKFSTKEEYGFWITVKATKNGKTEKLFPRVVQRRPVDFHEGISQLIEQYYQIEASYESVKIINLDEDDWSAAKLDLPEDGI